MSGVNIETQNGIALPAVSFLRSQSLLLVLHIIADKSLLAAWRTQPANCSGDQAYHQLLHAIFLLLFLPKCFPFLNLFVGDRDFFVGVKE